MVAKPNIERRQAARWQRAATRGVKRLEQIAAGGRPWFQRDGGTRLAHDAALLGLYGFAELAHEFHGGNVVLTGVIPIVTGASGITHRIATEVRFPNTYPRDEPSAFDIARRFTALPGKTLADRHLNEEGWCCLWLSSRSEWDARDPDALVRFLRQLGAFFERQLIYDVIKRWPGREFAHGDAGYVQDVRETLQEQLDIILLYEDILRGRSKPRRQEACPCGSGERFVVCHKTVFDHLGRRMPQRFLDGVRRGSICLVEPSPAGR